MNKSELKIVVFSSFDKEGGAAIACYNCVKLFRENGYCAIEVVRYKTGNDDFVYNIQKIRKKKSYFYRAISKIFPPKPFYDIKEDTDPEYRFFGDESDSPLMCSIEEIESQLPFIPNVIFVGHSFDLVNTRILNEMYQRWHSHIFLSCTDIGAYTGGCHVHWDCDGYTSGCSNCPAVLIENRKKEVAEAFVRKRNNIIEGNIGIRYSNNWLKQELDKSLIFKNQQKVFVGQNTDTDLYTPNNRHIAKGIFEIPNDAITIMNGSTSLVDKRKGLNYFCEAMDLLWKLLPQDKRDRIVLLIIGRNKTEAQPLLDKLPPFRIKVIDYITDKRLMSLAYQATDIFVSTSIEDAGPMMVSDSLACGTPVVGFKTGFIADEEILQDGRTGYVVNMRDTQMLSEKIRDIIMLSPMEYSLMSTNCRKVAVEKLSKYRTLSRYERLFEDL